LKKFLLLVLAAALGIQLIRVERTNPLVEQEPVVPLEVKDVLRRSCYNCHSHETVWPWYASVAPASWLIVRDVNEARAHLNFSRWNLLNPKDRLHMMREIWNEVDAGHMPLWYYLPLHPDAKLTEQDISTLRGWLRPDGVPDLE
jgi:hypothetical protein